MKTFSFAAFCSQVGKTHRYVPTVKRLSLNAHFIAGLTPTLICSNIAHTIEGNSFETTSFSHRRL